MNIRRNADSHFYRLGSTANVHSSVAEEVKIIPNYIVNKVHFDGDEEQIRQMLDFIKPNITNEEEEHDTVIDFNKIIPMPDSLDLNAGSVERRAVTAYLVAVNPFTKDFGVDKFSESEFTELANSLVKRYNLTKGDIYDDKVDPQEVERGQQYIDNIKKYNAPTWYEWRIQNWGCKWSASCQRIGENNTIYFDTPWATPTPVLQALSERFPSLTITCHWADEDFGVNVGEAVFENGEIAGLDYYEACSKQAYELAAELWELDLAAEGFVFDEEKQTYIRSSPDESSEPTSSETTPKMG